MADDLKQSDESDDHKGLFRQVDEWLGRRHRIWFFLTGIGLTVSVLWTLYSTTIPKPDKKIIDPSNKFSEKKRLSTSGSYNG